MSVCRVEVQNVDSMIQILNQIVHPKFDNGMLIKGSESYADGYFLTIDELKELVRDFQADCHDGFVSNDKAYIEEWLKKH